MDDDFRDEDLARYVWYAGDTEMQMLTPNKGRLH